jgi:hypothetical protein
MIPDKAPPADSLSNLTNPNPNLNANLNQSNSSKPLVFTPDSKVTPSENPDVLKASEMFVDEVFSKTMIPDKAHKIANFPPKTR